MLSVTKLSKCLRLYFGKTPIFSRFLILKSPLTIWPFKISQNDLTEVWQSAISKRLLFYRLLLSKPLYKLTFTDRQADRQQRWANIFFRTEYEYEYIRSGNFHPNTNMNIFVLCKTYSNIFEHANIFEYSNILEYFNENLTSHFLIS